MNATEFPGPVTGWLTLGAVLREKRRSFPLATATVCGAHRSSYAQLDARVNQLAAAMRVAGVGPGDRVLWLGQNCHRVLEGLLASARLGACFVPANWRQLPDELAFVIDDLRPALVLWQEQEIGSVVRLAREQASAANTARWIRHDDDGPDGYEAWIATFEPDEPDAAVSSEDPVLGVYTGAFTGRPSAALLSHVAVGAQSLMVAYMHDIDPSTVYLDCGPLFHVGTLMSTLATFLMSGCNVFIPRADAEAICEAVVAERCTRAFVVEPTRTQIVDLVAQHGYDLTSLQGWPGSDAWNAAVSPDRSRYGRDIGGYGQTELMGHVSFRGLAPGLGEHGRTSPLVELAILDDDGEELSPSEVGELAVRGPLVMNGYHQRASTVAHGWHRTGDLGRREDDGSITFIGPKARMLKSGVENVYPAEVEACIRTHPEVADCAVIGLPDPVWVQRVMAVVVRRPGSTLTQAGLVEHCRNHIAGYKKPREVAFVDELPRAGPVVDYAALDERFGGGAYPGGATKSIPVPGSSR